MLAKISFDTAENEPLKVWGRGGSLPFIMRNLSRSRKARGGRREKRRSSGFAELRVSPPDSPVHARADPFGMHTPSGAEVLRVGVIKDLSSQGRVIAEEAYNAEWEPGSPVPLSVRRRSKSGADLRTPSSKEPFPFPPASGLPQMALQKEPASASREGDHFAALSPNEIRKEVQSFPS